MGVGFKKTRIAVIGGGVGPLSAAYNLYKQVGYKCQVDMYQHGPHMEGPARVVESKELGCSVELKPQVFSSASHPEYANFIRELDVPTKQGQFAIFLNGAEHILGQVSLWLCLLRSFLSSPTETWNFAKKLHGFLRRVWEFLEEKKSKTSDTTLGQLMQRNEFPDDLIELFVEPLANAIMPYGTQKALDMDAYPVLKLLADHQILSFSGLMWKSVSSNMVAKTFLDKFKPRLHLNAVIREITQKQNDKWTINDFPIEYDAVVISITYPFLRNITVSTFAPEVKYLMDAVKSVHYEEETVFLHCDEKLMPEDKHHWGACVVADGVTTYWENTRQHITIDKNIFSTIATKDSKERIADLINKKSLIADPVTRSRPCFNTHNRKLAQKIETYSGSDGLYICGTPYTLNRVEDDYKSGVRVAHVHSDHAIPEVRQLSTATSKPIISVFNLIQALFIHILVCLFKWSMDKRINEGCVGILLPNQELLYFGNQKDPVVLLTIKKYRFIIYALLHAEVGWVESIYKGYASCNNLTLLAVILNQQLSQSKNLLQKLARPFRPRRKKGYNYHEQVVGFYESILDGTQSTSSGIFESEDEPLEDAQIRKMNKLIDSLGELNHESQVLEIGQGRGSFAVYLAKRVGCKVTCITKSAKQIKKLATEGKVENLLEIHEMSLSDIELHLNKDTFDAIICIESLDEIPGKNYDRYFKVFKDCSKKEGRIVLQIMCGSYNFSLSTSDLLKVYGISGTTLPSLGDIHISGARNGFVISNCARISEHYIYTARKWTRNFLDYCNMPECKFTEEFKRSIHIYLQLIPAMMSCKQVELYQLTMDKSSIELNKM